MAGYKTVYEGKQGEYEEKKSRFIASVAHVETEEEAMQFVESVRKKYYDARHNCYAYILGQKQDKMRFSDDGEPSQTAGKPILDVLLGAGLCDTICVVTRYFGGTLLGTGGLVRSYTSAAKDGIENSTVIEKQAGLEMWVTVDYGAIGKLLYLIGQKGYTQMDSDYGEKVTLILLVPKEEAPAFEAELTEVFSAKAELSIEGELWYAKNQKKLLIFS